MLVDRIAKQSCHGKKEDNEHATRTRGPDGIRHEDTPCKDLGGEVAAETLMTVAELLLPTLRKEFLRKSFEYGSR
jgi:hypothetical protein